MMNLILIIILMVILCAIGGYIENLINKVGK